MIDSYLDLSEPTTSLEIHSAPTHPAMRRIPIKHVLIGLPPAIQHTIYRLHQLHYADADLWSPILTLTPDRPLTILPNPGEGVAILVRHLTLEQRNSLS